MTTTSNNSPVRVKICGITRVEDALAASSAGADAIGLVFYAQSPRYIELGKAREIALEVGPFVSVVGLFVDASSRRIEEVLRHVPLSVLQFHGDETEPECVRFGRPYLKALRMRPQLNVAAAISNFASASGILLDAYIKGVPGGTGESFDWQRVPRDSVRPLVLAGGLNPDNVAAAVAATQVYGVDVSGGVESAPGIKDAEKIAAFIRRTRAIDERSGRP